MNTWKRLAGIALLFVAGFLAGLTASSALELGTARADRGRFWNRSASPLSSEFYSDLHLEEKQRESIETILEKKREELKTIKEAMSARVKEILNSGRGEIEPIFDAEQRSRYDQKLADWEEQLRRRQEKMREGFHSREPGGAAEHSP